MTEHTLATATVAAMKNWARKPADFYPTPANVVFALIKYLDLRLGAWICDPACGEGDLADVFKALGFNVEASDIRFTGYGEGGIDFLQPPDDRFFFRHDLLVTNPPFALAEEFIRTMYGQSGRFALLLKSNYWNAGGRLKLWDECTPSGHHPLTWRPAFLKKERGNSPLMDCDWWIWDVEQPKLPTRPFGRPSATETPVLPPRPLTVHLKRLGAAVEELEAAFRGR